MGRWLQKYIPDAPDFCTDSLDTLSTKATMSRLSVHDMGVSNFTEAEQEEYKERASIMEFDAGMCRADAEHFARQNVIDIRKYRK